MNHQTAPTPLLMVVTGSYNTVLTSSQSMAFEKARGPKKLVSLDKTGNSTSTEGNTSSAIFRRGLSS